MKYIYNTKKAKKYKKRRATMKLVGGAKTEEPSEEVKQSSKANKQHSGEGEGNGESGESEEIMENVEAAHTIKMPTLSSLANSPFIIGTFNLVKSVVLSAIQMISGLLGVDLTNPEQTNEKLSEIKATLSDPETQEKIIEILEAIDPYIEPLLDKFIEELSKVGTKSATALMNAILNISEGIPGAGIIIGGIRAATNVGEAIWATINAFTSIVTKTADTANASVTNLKRIADEKSSSISDSIGEFENPLGKFSDGTHEEKNDEDSDNEYEDARTGPINEQRETIIPGKTYNFAPKIGRTQPGYMGTKPKNPFEEGVEEEDIRGGKTRKLHRNKRYFGGKTHRKGKMYKNKIRNY